MELGCSWALDLTVVSAAPIVSNPPLHVGGDLGALLKDSCGHG